MAAATITTLGGKVLSLPSFYERADYKNSTRGWISGVLAVPAAGWSLNLSITLHSVSLLWFMFQC